jgi:hypothetical protein
MKRRHIIAIASFALIITLWAVFMALPQQREKGHIKKQLTTSESQLSDYNKIMREFSATFKAYEQLLQRKEHLISKLFSKDDVLRLLDELNRLSSKYNIEIAELSPSVEELIALNKVLPRDGQPLELDIVVKMRGGFQNIGRFINIIEQENFYKGLNFCHIHNQGIGDPRSFASYGFKAMLGTIKESG